MSKHTDYCNAIAALLAEQHKIPRLTVGMTDRERGRINILRKALHRQMEGLQQQAAKEFATFNGWRHTDRMFSIKTLARGGTHAAPGEIPWELYPPQLLDHPRLFSGSTTALSSSGGRRAALRCQCGRRHRACAFARS